jgi:hypothetical protein
MAHYHFSAAARILTILLVVLSARGARAETKPPPHLPPQELIDAIFPQGAGLPPLVVVLTKIEGSKPDALCGLAPADLTESRGTRTRTYKILIKAPDSDPARPNEAFFKVSRFTVDADGSSRAYHPTDPLGTAICESGKSTACALDELSSADIQLFRGTKEIDSPARDEDSADYLETWAKAWSLIAANPGASIDHLIDPRIPMDYALYYLKDQDLTVVFKTSIIPFRNGAPCMRGPKLADPGYFVAATAFTKTKVTPRTICDPAHYLDASKIPFFVVPGEVFGNLSTGDIAVGFAHSETGDRIVFGIVGDTGPFYETAEASVAFNSKMLRRTKPLKNATELDDIDIELGNDHITAMGVLVLGGTASALHGDYSAENIAAVGKRLLTAWSAKQKPADRLGACLDSAPLNPWK